MSVSLRKKLNTKQRLAVSFDIKTDLNNDTKKILRRRRSETNIFEELVVCEICNKRFENPKMLSCQHTFCYTCLENQLVKQEEVTKLQCPLCKKETIVKHGNMKLLQNNLYIDSILKVLDADVQNNLVETFNPKCSHCKTDYYNVVQHQCVHCRLEFCNICWGEHAKILQQEFEIFHEKLSEAYDLLKYQEIEHNQYIFELQNSIKTDVEEKIKALKEHERTLLIDVENYSKKNVNQLKKMKRNIAEVESQINEMRKHNMPTHMDKTYMTYHKQISDLLGEITHFELERKTVDMENYKLIDNYSEPNKQQTDALNQILLTKANLRLHYQERNFKSKFTWLQSPKLLGLGIPSWAPNLLYITNVDAKNVLIFNRTENRVEGALSHAKMVYPYGIAFHEAGREIFVSDKWNHCLHVFNAGGKYERSLASRGREPGQLLSPKGLALTKTGELLVCDSGNERVLVLDPKDGTQLAMLDQFNMPSDVDVFEDKIIIADTGNNRIKVYNNRYEKISEIGSMGKSRGQFHYPEVVAVDKKGFIFVGDAGNMRLQIFDQSGNLIRVIGGPSSDLFKWVSGILVTADLEIITTDYKNKCLMIF